MASVRRDTRQQWIGVGTSVWVQIAGGNAYNFPLYSHSLKSVLGFTQSQLTMLGVANDIGENVGLLPGYVCNKFPPWIVVCIGALSCFVGYGVLLATLNRTIPSLPYPVLWLALCVATNSNAWFTTAVLVTNMRNFPRSRGIVAGILKGYGGLSAAVYTEIYSVLLGNSSSKLLMFLTIVVPILCFALMRFVSPCTPETGEDPLEEGHFSFIQVASVVLGIYVLTTTILDEVFSLSAPVAYFLLLVTVLLLMAPLAIPFKMSFYPSHRSESALPNQDTSITEPLLEPSSLAVDTTITEPLVEPSSLAVDTTSSEPQIEPSSSAVDATSSEPQIEPSSSAVDATGPDPQIEPSSLAVDTTSSEPTIEPSSSAVDTTSTEPLIDPFSLAVHTTITEIVIEPSSSEVDTTSAAPPIEPSSPAVSIGSFQGDSPSDVNMLIAVAEGAVKKRRPRRGEDFTFAEAMVKLDFWLLFLVYFAGVGTGVTVLNNLAQIGIAQCMHDTKILLSLFSFFNFVGRLGGGILSEYGVRSNAVPRTMWMSLTQLVMGMTYILFATGSQQGTLFVATSLLGICYGCQFSIMVSTASELFGLKNFGLIFNFISLGNPLGAYLFSNLLAGYRYDKEAAKQHSSTCLGPDCFSFTFFCLAGVCCGGIIASVCLTARIMPVYRKLYGGEGSHIDDTTTTTPADPVQNH